MQSFDINIYYDHDKEEATISLMSDMSTESKTYNRIVTEGDVGVAVKDFVMGMEKA